MSGMPHPTIDPSGASPGEAASAGLPERASRTNLYLGALLSAPGTLPREVRVRNLSAAGARIDMADPPGRGTIVLLSRGSAEVVAEVAWVTEASCGLRFSGTIDVVRWMSDRPGAATPGVVVEPTLSEDLALVRKLVGRLEEQLAERPEVIAALGAELQSLDLVAQLLRLAERRAGGSSTPELRGLRQAAATQLRRMAGSASA
jgi:hypothetical protein